MQATITSTANHPYCNEILGILAQVLHLDDDDLSRLAVAWSDTPATARARDRALRPDVPLILEVLASFDSVSTLFADDLEGIAEYVTLPPPVTALALKAVRDAIAAAYARPILSAREYDDLSRPWRTVFPEPGPSGPDFGPQHEDLVMLLTAIPQLACRSHDPQSAKLWQTVQETMSSLDRDRHAAAIDSAWHATILSGRRRVWGLLNRSCQEGYRRRCGACDRDTSDDELAVLALCLGAAAGLLVRDLLDDESVAVLTSPVAELLAAS